MIPAIPVMFSVGSATALGDNGDLSVGGEADHLLHQRLGKALEPGAGSGAAEKNLGNSMFASEVGDRLGNVAVGEGMRIDAQVAGEMHVAFDGLARTCREFGPAALRENMEGQAIAAQVIGHALAAPD